MRAGELVAGSPVGDTVAAIAVKLLACRADASVGGCIELKVFGAKQLGGLGGRTFVGQRIGQCFVLVLIGKALIAPAHQIVSHQGWYVLVVQGFEVGFTVVPRIGGDEGVGVAHGIGQLYRRQQRALLGARAVRHCSHDDLMGAVHRCNCGVALDYALGGGHLGAVVVGDVAFTDAALGAFAFAVAGQEVPDAGRFMLQMGHALGVQANIVFVNRGTVAALMVGDHLLDGALHAVRLVCQLGKAAAALLAGVAGQLDAINGEHVSANQTLGIAGEQHLGEQGLNLGRQLADEFGDGGELGCAVTGQGHEEDVLAAGALDAAAGDEAPAIG